MSNDVPSSSDTERCPDCGSELEHKGASNSLGTQSVSYRPCSGCRGYENIDGEWVSEEQVRRALNAGTEQSDSGTDNEVGPDVER